MRIKKNKILYCFNTVSYEILLSFLETISSEHTPPLKQVVSLPEYALKLYNLGYTIEAWEDDKLRGIVAGYFNDLKREQAFISLIHVSSIIQGNGIGKTLMQYTFAHCKELGFKHLALMVNSSNVYARDFYIRLGFAIKRVTEFQEELVFDFE